VVFTLIGPSADFPSHRHNCLEPGSCAPIDRAWGWCTVDVLADHGRVSALGTAFGGCIALPLPAGGAQFATHGLVLGGRHVRWVSGVAYIGLCSTFWPLPETKIMV